VTIHGDGRASRDWLYVDDDAEAIEAIIAAPIERVAGEVLNVATGLDISVLDIAELVLSLLGKPASLRTHVEERPGQVRRHIGSTDKVAELCGWRARTSFEEGLARTVAWYRDNEPWWRGILANRETRPARGVSSS
jgi:dTDP-glucose 4,6-dehydratase